MLMQQFGKVKAFRLREMSLAKEFLSASMSNPLQSRYRSIYKVLDKNSPSNPPDSTKKPLV